MGNGKRMVGAVPSSTVWDDSKEASVFKVKPFTIRKRQSKFMKMERQHGLKVMDSSPLPCPTGTILSTRHDGGPEGGVTGQGRWEAGKGRWDPQCPDRVPADVREL